MSDYISRESVFEILEGYEAAGLENHIPNFVKVLIRKLPAITSERPSIDDVCKILSDVLGTPCNYGLDGDEVSNIIPSEWCEDNCPNNKDYSICWKKYFEIKYADVRGSEPK